MCKISQCVRSDLSEKCKTKDTGIFDENKSVRRNSKLYCMLSRKRSINVVVMLSRASKSFCPPFLCEWTPIIWKQDPNTLQKKLYLLSFKTRSTFNISHFTSHWLSELWIVFPQTFVYFSKQSIPSLISVFISSLSPSVPPFSDACNSFQFDIIC